MSDAPQGPHDALEGGRDAAGYGTPGTGFIRTPADRDEFSSRVAVVKLSMGEKSVGSKSVCARTGVEEHAAQRRSAPSPLAHSAGKLTSIISGRRAGAVSERLGGVGIEDAKLALALLAAGVCAFDERSGSGTCRYLHPAGDDGLREQVDSEGFWSALGIWRNFRDRGKGASAAAGADI